MTDRSKQGAKIRTSSILSFYLLFRGLRHLRINNRSERSAGAKSSVLSPSGWEESLIQLKSETCYGSRLSMTLSSPESQTHPRPLTQIPPSFKCIICEQERPILAQTPLNTLQGCQRGLPRCSSSGVRGPTSHPEMTARNASSKTTFPAVTDGLSPSCL